MTHNQKKVGGHISHFNARVTDRQDIYTTHFFGEFSQKIWK